MVEGTGRPVGDQGLPSDLSIEGSSGTSAGGFLEFADFPRDELLYFLVGRWWPSANFLVVDE